MWVWRQLKRQDINGEIVILSYKSFLRSPSELGWELKPFHSPLFNHKSIKNKKQREYLTRGKMVSDGVLNDLKSKYSSYWVRGSAGQINRCVPITLITNLIPWSTWHLSQQQRCDTCARAEPSNPQNAWTSCDDQLGRHYQARMQFTLVSWLQGWFQ